MNPRFRVALKRRSGEQAPPRNQKAVLRWRDTPLDVIAVRAQGQEPEDGVFTFDTIKEGVDH